MRIHRQIPRPAGAVAGLALTAVLACTLTACGSGGKTTTTSAPPTSSSPAAATPPVPSGTTTGGTVLATIRGPEGILVTLTSAERDAGGFVTVAGTLKNTGTDPFTHAGPWSGNEQALVTGSPHSIAGATLVDLKGKKRYYVLRDTDGNCLCTTHLDIIQPGATVPIYAQFPAPPATTTQVEFELPTLPAASIAISK